MSTAVVPRQSLVVTFAQRYGVDADKLLDTLKATAFKQAYNAPAITNEQMMALLVVANEYKLNPFTKEIFAFPDKKNGIIPVVSVDGWTRIINEHPQFDGEEFEEAPSDEWIIGNTEHKPCPSWLACVMYRKDRSRPTRVKEYMDEVYRPPFIKDGAPVNGPWQTHTKRMLRHKAHIQCARLAFGFAGIYDEDEAMRILEAQDVTPVINVSAGQSRTSTAKEAARRAVSGNAPADHPGEPIVVSAVETPKEETDASRTELEVGSPYTVESAIKLMSTATNKKGLDALWNMILDDHIFRDLEVPPDIEDYYKQRREELPDSPPKKAK